MHRHARCGGIAGVPSPGHAFKGTSREPRRAPCLFANVGSVRPKPNEPGLRGRGGPPTGSEGPSAAKVTCRQGKPEAAATGRRAVLRTHSTDEGGEPQGSRKGRPRYPLEGRGKQVDVSMRGRRPETPNSEKPCLMDLSRLAELARDDPGRKFLSIAHLLTPKRCTRRLSICERTPVAGVDRLTYAEYEQQARERIATAA